MWRLLALLQVVPDAGATVTVPQFVTPETCGAATGSEILVCRKKVDPNLYRLPPRDERVAAEPGLPKAEFGLFGKVRGSVNAKESNVGGFTAPAAMFTLTAPF
jgi:hypothetical protein